MVLKRTLDKVIFDNAALSQECNVFAHPRNENLILISEKATLQQENEAYTINWQNIENITAANRNEMIRILGEKWFNLHYRIGRSRFMDTVGDGSGVNNHKGDYSSASSKAIIKPGPGKRLFIDTLYIHIKTSAIITDAKYGSMAALTNGIRFVYEKQDGTLIKDFTDGITIKSNADFSLLGFSISPLSEGAGLNHVSIRYSHLYKHVLELASDEQFVVYFNDDFTDLVNHNFYAVAFSLE